MDQEAADAEFWGLVLSPDMIRADIEADVNAKVERRFPGYLEDSS
jgi:hypothetical protein